MDDFLLEEEFAHVEAWVAENGIVILIMDRRLKMSAPAVMTVEEAKNLGEWILKAVSAKTAA